LETKIEYQLPLELAEKLAMEQAMIQIAAYWKKRWHLPIIFGIFGVGIFADNDCSIFIKIILTVIGFCLGFGVGYLFQNLIRAKIVKRAKKQAVASYEKLGASRAVFWDAEWLTISTANWKTQIKWQTFDGLKDELVGVHLLYCEQSIFSIPKTILPPNLAADDLIKIWNGYLAKPPKLR
jgi:hypothetical protein